MILMLRPCQSALTGPQHQDRQGGAAVGVPRVRRLAGLRSRRAARVGEALAGRSGAAPHGVRVQAGGEGGGGAGRSVGCGAPRSEGSSGRRGREWAGLPAPTRGHIPFAGFAAGRGSPAHLHGTPDDIYQRVVSPEVPATPLWSPRVAKAGLLGGANATSRPHSCSSRVPALCFLAFRAAPTPHRRPDQSASGLPGVDPGRDAGPDVTGVTSRCAGRPTSPLPCVFTQVREGW